jgi:hypothetical protein
MCTCNIHGLELFSAAYSSLVRWNNVECMVMMVNDDDDDDNDDDLLATLLDFR